MQKEQDSDQSEAADTMFFVSDDKGVAGINTRNLGAANGTSVLLFKRQLTGIIHKL